MDSKINNNEKILLVLKEMNCKVSSNDLASFTKINVKNIGRYLKKLSEKKLISRKIEQVGKKRYNMNKILAKGKKYKFTHTYSDLKDEMVKKESVIDELSKTKRAFEIRQEKAIKPNETLAEVYDVVSEKVQKIDAKTELLSIFKILPIRDIDAKKLGLFDKQELIEKITKLILEI